jgi:hypothetical protein
MGLAITARAQTDALWICASSGDAGFALRAASCPSGQLVVTAANEDTSWTIDIATSIGPVRCVVEFLNGRQQLLRVTSHLIPAHGADLDAWPRDLMAFAPGTDPLAPTGAVHTRQRGLRSGVVYGTMTSPSQKTFLYFQDFSSLNTLLADRHATPKDSVGGEWPLMGFAMPAGGPLTPGKEYVISDAYLAVVDGSSVDANAQAQVYLDLMAEVYLALPKRTPAWHDWRNQAAAVLHDLTFSPMCSQRLNGQRYLLPYVDDRSKPPESMVQLTVILALREYDRWIGRRSVLARELLASLPRFFDPKIGSVVRWLPGVSFGERSEDGQSPSAMDSWYLYHVLFNLSRLAKQGHRPSQRLFTNSLPFAIKVAQRFGYRWPVFFDLTSLEVIRAETSPGRGGERDVAGLYALVMLQALEMTGKPEYLEEAQRAAETLANLGFELGYQMNTTAFAAQAMVGLLKRTGDEKYASLVDVCLANLIDNLWLWDCGYGNGASQKTFFGSFPLHDAPYLAAYEEAEMVATIHDLLNEGRERLRPSARIVLAEYLRYAQDRLWAYLPDHQAPEAVAVAPRVGRIERSLAIPLEDLTDGWEASGNVGQEVYGAAFAFVATTRYSRRLSGTSSTFHADYPVFDFEQRKLHDGGSASFRLGGHRRGSAAVRIVPGDPNHARPLVDCHQDGREVRGELTPEGHHRFQLHGDGEVRLSWRTTR